jgi:formylglycine-generating enzyme required for sulfatase activity
MQTTGLWCALSLALLCSCKRSEPTAVETAAPAAAAKSATSVQATSPPSKVGMASHSANVVPSSTPNTAQESPRVASDSGGSVAGSLNCPAGMAFIPAGTFTMGSVHKEPKDFRESASPLADLMEPSHKVKVDAYCLDIV